MLAPISPAGERAKDTLAARGLFHNSLMVCAALVCVWRAAVSREEPVSAAVPGPRGP